MVRNCLICHKEFYIRPHWVKKGRGFYCSRECYCKSEAFLVTRRKSLTKERMLLKCDCCGKTFERLKCNMKRGKQYCSKKCLYKSFPSGENASGWKGGRTIKKNGNRKYISVYAPNHPNARGKRVFEHRLVMEKQLGRYLTDKEVVHHNRGIGLNNHIDNLRLFPNNAEHLSFELTKKAI